MERVKTAVTLEGHDIGKGDEGPDISILGIDLTKERTLESLPPSPALSIHEDDVEPKPPRQTES
jgi:hypothetical protein